MERKEGEEKQKPVKREDITPIIDGDARPDINLNPGDEERNHPIPTPADKKKKTTKNRVDTNSLEDFRDAM